MPEQDQISAQPVLHCETLCSIPAPIKHVREKACQSQQIVQIISNLTVIEDMRQVIKKLLVFSAVCPDSVTCEMSFIGFFSFFIFHILFAVSQRDALEFCLLFYPTCN